MMQLVLLLLTLLVVFNRPVISTIVLADFQQQALVQHNYLRQLHCTGPLKLNSTLNTGAQAYAEYLAKNNIFVHSRKKGLGENLWEIISSGAINFVNGRIYIIFFPEKYQIYISKSLLGSTPTNSWYNEISKYNYSSPGYSESTDHFTQVIWKGSTQLGIGIAPNNIKTKAYVVANYYPEGNVIGSFPDNVLPFCLTTQ